MVDVKADAGIEMHVVLCVMQVVGIQRMIRSCCKGCFKSADGLGLVASPQCEYAEVVLCARVFRGKASA